MRRFRTSAQRTVFLSEEEVIQKLKDVVEADENIVFKESVERCTYEVKRNDGVIITISAQATDRGKTFASIEYKHVPVNENRNVMQKRLKEILVSTFPN